MNKLDNPNNAKMPNSAPQSKVQTNPKVNNSDQHTKSFHKGPLLVTSKQKSSQSCCCYCRAVMPKPQMAAHLKNCKILAYQGDKKRYTEDGTYIAAPVKPLATKKKAKASVKIPATFLENQKAPGLEADPSNPLLQFMMAAGIQTQGSSIVLDIVDYEDVQGKDAITTEGSWHDLGLNLTSVLSGGIFEGLAKPISATLEVLPRSSILFPDAAESTVLLIGGTPMISPNQDGSSAFPRLVECFSHTLMTSVEPRWERVAHVNLAKLFSEGYEQDLLSTEQIVTAFRFSMVDPDTGFALQTQDEQGNTVLGSLQFRHTYRVEFSLNRFFPVKIIKKDLADWDVDFAGTDAGIDTVGTIRAVQANHGTF